MNDGKIMKKHGIEYIWSGKKCTFLGLPISFTRYYITETKLITRSGFFSISEDEIELYKVVDKKITYPFSQRLVGCGTITIFSKDIDTPQKDIVCIKNVRKVSDILDTQINLMRDKYGIRGRDMVGSWVNETSEHV